MSSLPHYIDPWQMFRHHETFRGMLSLEDMPSLRASQHRDEGFADVELKVNQRDDGFMVLIGQASIELALDCQRCLQPIVKTFTAAFEFVLVRYERELDSVNADDDAMVVEETLAIAPLVEQELILVLPMVIKHEDCQMAYKNANSNSAAAKQRQPFAQLKDLLTN